MDFLKRSAEEWLQLEEREIEDVVKSIDTLPSLGALEREVKELRNGLVVLKKNRKPALAANIQARAQNLHRTFSDLVKRFDHIKEESGRITQMERDLVENFVQAIVTTERGTYVFHFRKKTPFRIGRNNVPELPDFVSREHLELTCAGETLRIKAIGRNPTLLSAKQGFGYAPPVALTTTMEALGIKHIVYAVNPSSGRAESICKLFVCPITVS